MILCKPNGKIYIGKTRDFNTRKVIHLSGLSRGEHENKELQKDYNLYGEDNFGWDILERCLIGDLDSKEIDYLNKYDSLDPKKGYNIVRPIDFTLLQERHDTTITFRLSFCIKKKIEKKAKENNLDIVSYLLWKALPETYDKKIGNLQEKFISLNEVKDDKLI